MKCTCAGCSGNCAGHNCEVCCGRGCSEPEATEYEVAVESLRLHFRVAGATLPSIKGHHNNREPLIMLDEVYAPSDICSRCLHYADSCAEPPCIDCLSPDINSPHCKYEPTKWGRVKLAVLSFIAEHATDILAAVIIGTVCIALAGGMS